MTRRQFLKRGAEAAAAGATLAVPAEAGAAAAAPPMHASTTPSILADYTADDHRRRLNNIARCTQGIRKCLRKHLIADYLPAQCVYNMGEYPSRRPWSPNEYDEQELDRLKAHGIQLVHVMDEWNDRYGLFGRDKFTAVNPKGFKRFVGMVHRRGMKVLAYASTGYFCATDPNYRKEWSGPGDDQPFHWWDLVRCSPASPGWRAYSLPRMIQILEDYELDGLYNDWGYVPNADRPARQLAKDAVAAFEETPKLDGAVADLLHLIYSEVKRRGGIYKMHADYANEPQTGGLKVYDYLWVGENVDNADRLREAVKNHSPYVVPCIQGSAAHVGSENDHFLHAIPYMQFPLLQGGRPLTGERAVIPIPRLPGVHEGGFYEAAWKYYQEHPSGPYVYGGWDPLPPNPNMRQAHAQWLKQYLPMVETGTWAYLEIADSDLFAAPLPKDCVASVFANREVHLVLANYGSAPAQVLSAEPYVGVDAAGGAPSKQWDLAPRSLMIVRRVG